MTREVIIQGRRDTISREYRIAALSRFGREMKNSESVYSVDVTDYNRVLALGCIEAVTLYDFNGGYPTYRKVS